MNTFKYFGGFLFLFVIALSISCKISGYKPAPEPAPEPAPVIFLNGYVLNENNQAIPNASVIDNTTGKSTQSDGNGYYIMTIHANQIASVSAGAYQKSASGAYVSKKETTGDLQINLQLRDISPFQNIELPTSESQSVNVEVVRDNTLSVLTIPYNALLLPNGSIANGTAQVSLTLWTHEENAASRPLPLLAEADDINGEPIPLVSFGMVDIEIMQNNQILSVVPGKSLTWMLQLSPSAQQNYLLFSNAFNQGNANSVSSMALYGYNLINNKNTNKLYSSGGNSSSSSTVSSYSGCKNSKNIWCKKDDLNKGSLTYDTQGRFIDTNITQTGPYNIDGTRGVNGGCIKGHLVEDCNSMKPIANNEVYMWLFPGEGGVLRYPSYALTDKQGYFCVEAAAMAPGATKKITLYNNTVRYTIDTRTIFNEFMTTNKTFPLPSACLNCSAYNRLPICTSCDYFDSSKPRNTYSFGFNGEIKKINDNGNPYQCNFSNLVSNITNAEYVEACNAQTPETVTLLPCTFCGGKSENQCGNTSDYRNNTDYPVSNNGEKCLDIGAVDIYKNVCNNGNTPCINGNNCVAPTICSFGQINIYDYCNEEVYLNNPTSPNRPCCAVVNNKGVLVNSVCVDYQCLPASTLPLNGISMDSNSQSKTKSSH